MNQGKQYAFRGVFLTSDTNVPSEMPFAKVPNASALPEIDAGEKLAYVVPSLHADFLLLFPTAGVIITAAGSTLSHLAILAREHKIPVFLSEDIDFNLLPSTGTCSLQPKE